MTRRTPQEPTQARTRRPSHLAVFTAYCLLSATVATGLGAAVSLPFPAGVRLLVWAAVTLLVSVAAGLACNADYA
jgi:hypothetical protein